MEMMLGFQRAADGKNGHKEDNRFSVRCNFAVQQNCVKAEVRAQGRRVKGGKLRASNSELVSSLEKGLGLP